MVKKRGNKKATGGATGRAKPLTAKVSVTRRVCIYHRLPSDEDV